MNRKDIFLHYINGFVIGLTSEYLIRVGFNIWALMILVLYIIIFILNLTVTHEP